MSDGNGGTKTETSTETYWERVNTHYAKENYKFAEWVDNSPDNTTLDYL